MHEHVGDDLPNLKEWGVRIKYSKEIRGMAENHGSNKTDDIDDQ